MSSEETNALARIDAFQAVLLDALHAGGTTAEIRAKITKAADDAGLDDYVAGFDDRMIAVASELVRKWGGKLH